MSNRQMLPSSHPVPIDWASTSGLPSPPLLAAAFSEFIAASSLLEGSYRDLQQEVAHLNAELSQRNSALTSSLAENDRMRAALQRMLDSMPCGVLVLDNDEHVVMINPEGRRLLRIGNERVNSLCDLSRLSQIEFALLQRGSDDRVDSEVCIESSDGKRWLAIRNRKLNSTPVHRSSTDSARELQTIWILRDITSEKRAEQEREAGRRAVVLAEISTILAHEIRNPLASMELFAELIEQDQNESAQWISHLRAGIRTLSGTVNNVLSLNGECAPALVSVDLTACVQNGVEFVRPIAHQAGVSLSFEAPCESMSVEGNEDAIRQIILNITCNAIRHTATGGSIRVSLRKTQRNSLNFALVEVSDTGCGISEEIIERLFEPGFSGSGDTPGLGLAVCKRLMTQHRGRILVTSRVNRGTTFELEFPAL
jgi:two-component system sensor histidine kinase FlrB